MSFKLSAHLNQSKKVYFFTNKKNGIKENPLELILTSNDMKRKNSFNFPFFCWRKNGLKNFIDSVRQRSKKKPFHHLKNSQVENWKIYLNNKYKGEHKEEEKKPHANKKKLFNFGLFDIKKKIMWSIHIRPYMYTSI